jgi:hypothetical protein
MAQMSVSSSVCLPCLSQFCVDSPLPSSLLQHRSCRICCQLRFSCLLHCTLEWVLPMAELGSCLTPLHRRHSEHHLLPALEVLSQMTYPDLLHRMLVCSSATAILELFHLPLLCSLHRTCIGIQEGLAVMS